MTHPSTAELHDFADGEMVERALARLDTHLAMCPSCRATVEAVAALRDEVRDLWDDDGWSETEAVPDQWPEIERRIRAGDQADASVSAVAPGGATIVPLGGVSGRRWEGTPERRTVPGRESRLAWAAAAAIALIGVSTSVVILLQRTGARAEGGGGIVAASAPADGAGARDAAIAVAYTSIMGELEAILEEGQGRLLPETVEVLEENLRILDAAIGEVQAALARDPADVGMLRSLDGAYRARIGMLRRAVELTGMT